LLQQLFSALLQQISQVLSIASSSIPVITLVV